MTLDNATSNHNDRIRDAAPITFAGSALTVTGNASAATSETIGAPTFDGAVTFLTVTPGTGQSANLTTGTPGRANGGTAFVRGTSLGAAAGPNVAQVAFASVPLAGGGGTAGSTNISIIPWAYGNTSPTAAANAATNGLVTHGPTGVRPLDISTEYAPAIAFGTTSSDNIRITNSQFFGSSTTINALVVAPGGIEIGGGGALTISSGALLNLHAGLIVSNPLNFGASEAMVLAPSNLTLNAPIHGTGGLTKAAEGNATFNSAASAYTGRTVLAGGTNTFTGNVTSGGASGVFGADTSPIVLAGGNFTSVRLQLDGVASASFDRPIINNSANALGNQALLPRFGVAGNQTLVMNGDIQLNFPLAISGAAGARVILNGNISGGTFLTDTSTAITIQLNGNNTHAGMELLTGTFEVGSDTAFGSGIVKMAGLGTAPSIAAVGGPRTLANEVACLRLGGNYWQIVGDQPLTFTGSINLGGSFPHVINNTALTTYAGVLHTGGFTKQGTGTLVLSGDNIYTGITTISSGVLRITHGNALGSTAANTIVNLNSTLEVTSNTLSNEPLTLNGVGTANLGALYSHSGSNRVGTIGGTDFRVNVTNGTLTSSNVSAAADFSKSGTGTWVARRYFGARFDVLDGTAVVAPGRNNDKTSLLTALLITGPARMDLGDNDFVVDYGTITPFSAIRGYITSAYNGGAWNGIGLTSAQADGNRFALGYAESSAVFTSFPANFSGIIVDNTSVLVRWTRYGDANLDGQVNLDDFNRLAANFGTGSGALWTQGDFDYDGIVNLNDFNKLAANFGLSAAGPQVTPEDWAALGAAVPEPAIISTFLLGPWLLKRRRR
jgi:autotransporter-associated beta strand protein